jgi:hypothetical protein
MRASGTQVALMESVVVRTEQTQVEGSIPGDPDPDYVRQVSSETFHKLADQLEELKALEERERIALVAVAAPSLFRQASTSR